MSRGNSRQYRSRCQKWKESKYLNLCVSFLLEKVSFVDELSCERYENCIESFQAIACRLLNSFGDDSYFAIHSLLPQKNCLFIKIFSLLFFAILCSSSFVNFGHNNEKSQKMFHSCYVIAFGDSKKKKNFSK